jgi:type VI secretion system protein ImpI
MSLRLVLADAAAAQTASAANLSLGGKPRVVIGRDATADWQLPDAIRLVSSKHCEVVKEGTAYWLHDLSTNGTFVNGAPQRIADPHLLAAGDRIRVGNYIIAVEAEAEVADTSDDTIALRPRAKQAPAATPLEPLLERGADPASLVTAPAAPNGAHDGRAGDELTMIAPAPKPQGGKAAPAAEAAAPAATAAAPTEELPMIKHFARGLGLSEADIAMADAVKLAEHTGALLRSLTAGLMPLLAATAAHASPPSPGTPRNPLEDAPNPPAALEMLFGPPRRAYLDAERAYKLTLQELLERAQRASQTATDDTARRLDAFAPAAIEQQFAAAGRHAKFLTSKKAALWDFYVAQWTARGS